MVSQATALVRLVFLALTIAEASAYYGGRRGSSRSFVPLGRWSLGSRNDFSDSCLTKQRATSGVSDAEASLLSELSRLECEYFSHTSVPESEKTILAALKTKRMGRFLPTRRQSSGSKTQLRQQQTAPAETKALTDQEKILVGAAETLIPQDVWEKLTGDEYDDPAVVDRLAQAGLTMATKHSNNGWVDWGASIPSDLEATLDHGGIEVFKGSTLRPGYGSEVPWIKSISKLPFSPSEMIELMMDSSRVTTYNSLSLGREDVKVVTPPQDHQATKIVRNVVQLPVTNSKVESVTLLHTRKLENGSHLLVSRAIGGTKYYDGKMGTGYTLLGVNLFEPIINSPDECRLTAISHVYSPGVPLMIAGKVGIKSAKNFVKDIRALCVLAP